MHISLIEKHFLFSLLAIVSVLVLIIFYPFLTILVIAAAFAVVLNPIYNRIKKHITRGSSWIASILTIILFLIILCIPLLLVGTAVFNQIQDAYQNIISTGNTSSLIQRVDLSINRLMPAGFEFNTYEKITNMVSSLSSNLASFFTSTFKTILMFLLMILSMFYMLKDGSKWKNGFIKLFPISEKNSTEILNKLISTINQILKGSFLIAILQGALMWLGLTLFGVPNAIIWAVVASIGSFIPTIGTSIVSVPAILFLFFSGLHLQALGLLIWSAVIVGLVDNMITPYVISKNTEVSSLFILLSILGGVSLLGASGIIIGPLILSLLYSLVSIYKKEIENA